MSNRYLLKSQIVQTLMMEVDSGKIPLPSTTSTPPCQSQEAIVSNVEDSSDQLHL